MFTVGIFTTHLPYIALVVFYAFFWLFGINKASAGELSSGENIISLEFTATETVTDISQNIAFDVHDMVHQGLKPGDPACQPIALQRIIHNGYYLFKYRESSIYASLFSRPPPLSL